MKLLQNFGKLSNFFGDLKSMTNYLPFETNCRVLAQLVEKCQAIKDSYFQVQQKVKKMRKDMVGNHLCTSKKCGL